MIVYSLQNKNDGSELVQLSQIPPFLRIPQTNLIVLGADQNWQSDTYKIVAKFVDDPIVVTAQSGILLLGDSITFRGDQVSSWQTILNYSPIINGGVSSNTTSEMLSRLPALLANKPRACFIEGGVNDISLGFTQAQTIANIKSMMALCMAAGAVPLVQAVFPVSAAYSGPASVNNTNITALNKAVHDAIQTTPGSQYLNWASTLTAGDYVDGLHLNGSGYVKWNAALAPYVSLYR